MSTGNVNAFDIARPGSNSRLPALADAITATNDLAAFLDAHPVVQSEPEAHRGAKVLKAAKTAIAECKAEQADRLAPLKAQDAEIRQDYTAPVATLDTLTKRLASLLTAFNLAEERRRAEIAEAARRAAEVTELAAREAEARERAALDDAEAGVVGSGAAQATAEADAAFVEHARTNRLARVAEKSVPVRLGSEVGSRAVSLRTHEELTITDPAACLTAVGLTDGVRGALETAARAYRKREGSLPPGVAATVTRRI